MAVATLVAGLTAVRPSLAADDSTPAGPLWRSVDDASFRLDGARATANAALSATRTAPWLMAGWWQSSANANPRPVVWTTKDWSGVESPAWARHFLPLPKDTDSAVVNAIVPITGVTVAFGVAWEGSDADAAVWISTNRTSWRRNGSGSSGRVSSSSCQLRPSKTAWSQSGSRPWAAPAGRWSHGPCGAG